MADTILKNTKLAIMKEVTEGAELLPAAAGDFMGFLEDGANEMVKPTAEFLERGQLSAGLDKDTSRLGIKSAAGTIGVEFKSGEAAASPEWGVMAESALGATSAGSVDNTSSTGHTTSVINFASTAAFAVGKIVLVKEAGAYHVSPIKAIVTDTSIELEIAAATAFSDAVKVDVLADYRAANSGHPSFTVTQYIEDAVRETAAGAKVVSMALEGFITGQSPNLKFGYEALSFTRTLNAPAYTPDVDASLPIVALSACVWKDFTKVGVNEFAISLENSMGYKTTTCSANGRISSRVTGRKLTGSINPYKQTDSVADFDTWLAGETFSLFAYAYNPTATAGEFGEIVAVYLPKLQFSEIGQADADGILQDTLSFEAKLHASLPLMILATK